MAPEKVGNAHCFDVMATPERTAMSDIVTCGGWRRCRAC
jgi:hypothetical protein